MDITVYLNCEDCDSQETDFRVNTLSGEIECLNCNAHGTLSERDLMDLLHGLDD
jgi:hypothetical protein